MLTLGLLNLTSKFQCISFPGYFLFIHLGLDKIFNWQFVCPWK